MGCDPKGSLHICIRLLPRLGARVRGPWERWGHSIVWGPLGQSHFTSQLQDLHGPWVWAGRGWCGGSGLWRGKKMVRSDPKASRNWSQPLARLQVVARGLEVCFPHHP